MRDKIVTAVLGDDLYVKTSHVFQYDYGLKLMIEGIQLPAEYEIHFSNKKRGVAKKGELVEGGAKIPDEYLRSGDNVYAWVYLRNGDDDGYTIYSIEIPVVQRSVEQGDNINIIEHNIIDKTIEELNEAVAKSDENVTHYPYIDTETHHWMVYDANQETFVDTGVDAEGEIADVIDDLSGAGVTDKTWSADKLTTMDSGLNNAIERKFGVSNLKADGGLQVETDIETGKNYLVTEVYGDTIAPNYFDLTFPVKQGQYCYFGRNLWIANTEIATQEYFNRNHWTQVDVGTSLDTKEDKPDLIVNFNLFEDPSIGNWNITADKTTQEVITAYNNGKKIKAYITFRGEISELSHAFIEDVGEGEYFFYFSGMVYTQYASPYVVRVQNQGYGTDWTPYVWMSISKETHSNRYSVNDSRIANVADPFNAQDAATKNYVDTHAVAVPDLEIVFSVETNAETGSPLFIVNKTWEEFLAAYNAGKTIKATFVNRYAGGAKCELTAIQYDSTSATAYFNGAITYQETPRSVLVVWSANDLEYGHADFTVVDSALSSTSTNPVQNKIISAAINSLAGELAPNFSSLSFPVPFRTVCTHEGKLYLAIADVPSSVWDSEYWIEVPLGYQTNSILKSVLERYRKPSGGIPGSDLAEDYIIEPATEGTSGQVLTTDGNGGRTWQTPSGGNVIDDTTPAANKTFSSAKLTEMDSELKSAINLKFGVQNVGNGLNVGTDTETGRTTLNADVQRGDITNLQQNKADIIITSASGSIASISDGADDLPIESMTVQIEPVQDLNGQSNPYPAGGGKNKIGFINASGVASGTNKTVSVASEKLTVTASANVSASSLVTDSAMESICVNRTLPVGTYTFSLSGFATSFSGVNKANVKLVLSDNTEVSEGASFVIAEGITISALKTSSAISWTANAYISFNVQIEPGSTATAWSPYENICPISGWTGATVYRTGKNLWNKQVINGDQIIDGLKAGETYTVTADATDSSSYCYVRSRTGTDDFYLLGRVVAGSSKQAVTFTAEAGRDYSIWSNSSYANIKNVQIEPGSTATAYEPYQGATYPITWESAGTVYGGTLNPVTGELVVTHGQIASYAGETLPSEWISDRDVYAAGTTPTTGAQVVYELAEPITYTLTPPEIRTLLGANNIWADTGDVSVEYRADTKLYIDGKQVDIRSTIAPIEDGTTASQAYAAGKFFYHGGNFCKAKTSIASGATFTLNTNYEITTVADALYALQ